MTSEERREGVTQFLTKGSEVSWIWYRQRGEEWVQNPENLADVIYGWPNHLWMAPIRFPIIHLSFFRRKRTDADGGSLLTWGQGKIHNNLQRIFHHKHIRFDVLIHIKNEFKLYPYIQLSKSKLGNFLNLAHFLVMATQCTQVAN